jgi:DNA-binding CsgD family transcriptional regulator
VGEKRPAQLRPPLTRKQCQVLQLIAEGSDRVIGDILNISEETAATHVKDIYLRYGVNKRTLLVYSRKRWLPDLSRKFFSRHPTFPG